MAVIVAVVVLPELQVVTMVMPRMSQREARGEFERPHHGIKFLHRRQGNGEAKPQIRMQIAILGPTTKHIPMVCRKMMIGYDHKCLSREPKR
jgi:hypothetical protein